MILCQFCESNWRVKNRHFIRFKRFLIKMKFFFIYLCPCDHIYVSDSNILDATFFLDATFWRQIWDILYLSTITSIKISSTTYVKMSPSLSRQHHNVTNITFSHLCRSSSLKRTFFCVLSIRRNLFEYSSVLYVCFS